MAENDYAVVVGINTYPDLGSLGGPANDALDFYEWLLAADGGNVPKKNVALIVSPEYPVIPPVLDAHPRAEQVEQEFLRIAFELKESGVQARRLYLYFAGHGFSKEVDEAAVLMANAARGMSTILHIPGRAYANRFSKTSFFREVVLFMDCCREDFKMTQPRPPVIDDIGGANAAETLFGFAAKWSRASREGPWGKDQKVRGIFTLALLAGLRGGAARDENNQVTLEKLAEFVYNYVSTSLPEPMGEDEKQDPQFAPSSLLYKWKFNPPPGEAPCNVKPADVLLVAPDPPVIEPARPPAHYVVNIAAGNGNAGKTFQVTAWDSAVIPVVKQTASTWTWHVPQGYYKVTRSDGASKLFEVGGANETIAVEI
ncbi:MAG: caspase family protein [Thermoanaerobaculia bacterium]